MIHGLDVEGVPCYEQERPVAVRAVVRDHCVNDWDPWHHAEVFREGIDVGMSASVLDYCCLVALVNHICMAFKLRHAPTIHIAPDLCQPHNPDDRVIVDGGREGNVLSWVDVPISLLDSLVLAALSVPPAAFV